MGASITQNTTPVRVMATVKMNLKTNQPFATGLFLSSSIAPMAQTSAIATFDWIVKNRNTLLPLIKAISPSVALRYTPTVAETMTTSFKNSERILRLVDIVEISITFALLYQQNYPFYFTILFVRFLLYSEIK